MRLPAGTRIIQSSAYTGPQGAQGKDFRVVTEAPGLYVAETTAPLPPGDGFTVAVAFPKGVLTPPTSAEETQAFVSDNAGIIAVIVGVFAALFYYLYAWMKVGRDPPKGVVVPLFAPPTGMGPAGVRYVVNQGFDDKAFAASLVGLAVKGWLKISDDDKSFTIRAQATKGQPLTQAEAALLGAIPNGTTELKQANNAKVRAMREALRRPCRRSMTALPSCAMPAGSGPASQSRRRRSSSRRFSCRPRMRRPASSSPCGAASGGRSSSRSAGRW